MRPVAGLMPDNFTTSFGCLSDEIEYRLRELNIRANLEWSVFNKVNVLSPHHRALDDSVALFGYLKVGSRIRSHCRPDRHARCLVAADIPISFQMRSHCSYCFKRKFFGPAFEFQLKFQLYVHRPT